MNQQSSLSSTAQVPTPAPLLLKVAQLADLEKFDDARQLLADVSRHSDEIRNARGVLMMRTGQIEAAVGLLRTLALAPGCTWLKPGAPVYYQTNYATSLLLFGRPQGATSVLADIREKNHPSVLRLREAIRSWERRLPWWQRLNWKLGVAPDGPVPLEFAPGDIVDPMALNPGAVPMGLPSARQAKQHVA